MMQIDNPLTQIHTLSQLRALPLTSVSPTRTELPVLKLITQHLLQRYRRSPWSYKYCPPLDEVTSPSLELRKLEIEANDILRLQVMMAMTVKLPLDIIRAILLFLPIKALLRFKLVSQSWRQLITDPDFAMDYYWRSMESPELLVVLDDDDERFYNGKDLI
ncbi:hypothetical protein Dimus_012492 [Dionaea muscipula]